MTESEERYAIIHEMSWLHAKVWEATGHHPRVINEMLERGGIDLRALDARELADLCRAIREEFPSLDLGAP